MRIVKLSETNIRDLFKTVALSNTASDVMGLVILKSSGTYGAFVHTVLTLHSGHYIRATSHDNPVSRDDMAVILSTVRKTAPWLSEKDILIADKMDVLYGTDYRTYCEHNKFSSWFYESVFESVTNILNENNITENHDEIFEETVRAMEFIISLIEQIVVFSPHDVDMDDTIVISVVPSQDSLLFLTI